MYYTETHDCPMKPTEWHVMNDNGRGSMTVTVNDNPYAPVSVAKTFSVRGIRFCPWCGADLTKPPVELQDEPEEAAAYREAAMEAAVAPEPEPAPVAEAPETHVDDPADDGADGSYEMYDYPYGDDDEVHPTVDPDFEQQMY